MGRDLVVETELFAEQNLEDWPRYNRETSIRVAYELKVGWDDDSSPFVYY